jgi:general stress protein CsbA
VAKQEEWKREMQCITKGAFFSAILSYLYTFIITTTRHQRFAIFLTEDLVPQSAVLSYIKYYSLVQIRWSTIGVGKATHNQLNTISPPMQTQVLVQKLMSNTGSNDGS